MLRATYIARADKAHTELGWTPRPLREGLRETLDAIAATEPLAPPVAVQRKRWALIALTAALGLFVWWGLRRGRRHR
jgi:hypothetical protein